MLRQKDSVQVQTLTVYYAEEEEESNFNEYSAENSMNVQLFNYSAACCTCGNMGCTRLFFSFGFVVCLYVLGWEGEESFVPVINR